jgi:hypothetical protein
MSANELKDLLEHLEDTREIVIDAQVSSSAAGAGRTELMAVWSAARAEANLALEAWRSERGAAAYAVFLAAEDRADAAQDALAA